MFKSEHSNLNLGKIIDQSDDYVIYQFDSTKNNSEIMICPVLQGIEIIFFNFHVNYFAPINNNLNSNILVIHHCLNGRAEFTMEDGCNQYIGEGDMFMNMIQNHSHKIELPLNYYRGLNITIDLDKAAPTICNLIPNINIDLKHLVKNFFINDDCFALQAREELNCIFNGLYKITKEARSSYLQIKMMELILYLYFLDVQEEQAKEVFYRPQVEIIKKIQSKLVQNLDYRYKIDELAKEYFISSSTLKKYFKGVYGKSIALYLKEQRINKAGTMLKETDMNISDISSAVGYQSQSKFGVAFKEIMKITPIEYRRKYMYPQKQ